MSRLVSEFSRGLKGLKVGELPAYVGGFSRTHLTPSALYARSNEHLHGPVKSQMDAGSVKPLFNTMALLFVGAYALAWPTVSGMWSGVGCFCGVGWRSPRPVPCARDAGERCVLLRRGERAGKRAGARWAAPARGSQMAAAGRAWTSVHCLAQPACRPPRHPLERRRSRGCRLRGGEGEREGNTGARGGEERERHNARRPVFFVSLTLTSLPPTIPHTGVRPHEG